MRDKRSLFFPPSAPQGRQVGKRPFLILHGAAILGGSDPGKPRQRGQMGLGITGSNPASYPAAGTPPCLYNANDHRSVPGGSTINSFPKSLPRDEKHFGEEAEINLSLPTAQELLSAPVLTAYPGDLQEMLGFYPKGCLHSAEPDNETASGRVLEPQRQV